MTGIMRMSSASTVLVYEYFSGGGCPAGELPRGLAAEALGMLWALLVDFRRWGAMRTITALDPRFGQIVPGLNRQSLPADEIVCASPGEHEKIYPSLLKRCDAVLIIAPETNGILSELTAQAEKAGIKLLCSGARAAAVAGDKAACSRIFHRAGLSIPETRTAGFNSASRTAAQIGFPLVVKPIDGVGSEGVYRVDRLTDLPAILPMVRRTTSLDRILLQSFVRGIHASVSLFVAGGRCLPICLNRQLIDEGSPFQYRGSRTPLRHQASAQALELACSAVSLIPGLNGYVGVDMVLAEDGVKLIEINPRLTTSYIGVRQIARVNLAQTIWEACTKGVLPDRIPIAGRVVIKKDDSESWNLR
jgi:predicted ATP-grasp superfamily ATP-dependent carboligase